MHCHLNVKLVQYFLTREMGFACVNWTEGAHKMFKGAPQDSVKFRCISTRIFLVTSQNRVIFKMEVLYYSFIGKLKGKVTLEA